MADMPESDGAAAAQQQGGETLEDTLDVLGGFSAAVPEEVAAFFLSKSGFESPDPRVNHVIALAVQKFVSDVAHNALQYSKIRNQKAAKSTKKERPLELTLDDLSASLREYGINVNKPPYYADSPGDGGEAGPAGSGAAAAAAPRSTQKGKSKSRSRRRR